MNETNIHATSVVDENVTIGDGSKVWHFCHISSGSTIGANCTFGQNVFVGHDVSIGDRVKIQNNVSVYKGVILEDDVFVGPSAVFTNVINPRASIERKDEFKSTRVEIGATIGANATILCGRRIGAYSLVGAGSVVTRDVAPYSVVVGNPASEIGWVDKAGNRVEKPPSSGSSRIRTLEAVEENRAIQQDLEAAAVRVLRSGQFIMGPEVESFETAIKNDLDCEFAISCSSGTDALLLALMAKGIGPGDEVITTPFSFFATVGCILRLGATPVFADVDPITFNINLAAVERAVTPRTRAIIPVHLFGQTVDLSELRSPMAQRNIFILEDAAQAYGAKGDQGFVGNTNDAATFSFFPSKNLGGFGDGGLVATNDSDLAENMSVLRLHGSKPKYVHKVVGGNFRMDPLQAALLNVKLATLGESLKARRRHAGLYLEKLSSLQLPGERLQLPRSVGVDHTYNQFVIQTADRDALRSHLASRGIDSMVYYPSPLHLQEALKAHRPAPESLKNAETLCERVLALPVHPALQREEVERVCDAIQEFFS